jgi:hypothetical protein
MGVNPEPCFLPKPRTTRRCVGFEGLRCLAPQSCIRNSCVLGCVRCLLLSTVRLRKSCHDYGQLQQDYCGIEATGSGLSMVRCVLSYVQHCCFLQLLRAPPLAARSSFILATRFLNSRYWHFS